MPIIGVINQKGGVGKTTTAVNLSAALAERRRILLADLDPQANATSGVGIGAPEATLYDVIAGRSSARQAVIATSTENLHVLAASADLAGVQVEVDAGRENMRLLARGLMGVRPNYDFIIVDAPPSMGVLTLNALAAADLLIIPLQSEYYALEGIASMMDTVERVRGSVNPDLRILGIVLTMYDSRTRLSQEVEENVRKHFGDLVFKTIIPRTVRLAEAPSYGRSVLEYAPTSQGAVAYRELAEEVIERVSEA
ncbi:MAG: ParA family protein [Trueperaceae bacterium]|nr:ParA family protein [Trueperaceae bacterium]MCO5174509.1 ParA family protein [Trueperaceae bacterium]MCW5818265.1 ParA family protein [Trueperaceae bacterium]